MDTGNSNNDVDVDKICFADLMQSHWRASADQLWTSLTKPNSSRGGGVLAFKLIDLHKRYVEWWQRKLGISDYALMWLVFVKGVVFTLLVVWLIE